jgi:hypothetical protein
MWPGIQCGASAAHEPQARQLFLHAVASCGTMRYGAIECSDHMSPSTYLQTNRPTHRLLKLSKSDYYACRAC